MLISPSPTSSVIVTPSGAKSLHPPGSSGPSSRPSALRTSVRPSSALPGTAKAADHGARKPVRSYSTDRDVSSGVEACTSSHGAQRALPGPVTQARTQLCGQRRPGPLHDQSKTRRSLVIASAQRTATPPPEPNRLQALLRDYRPIKETLAGLTVSFAVVPEALAFSVVLGVPPQVALYSAAVMSIVTALLGARPGLISGVTGATAICLKDVVAGYGLPYALATVMLAGVFQMTVGVLRLGKLIRLVPQPVLLGFVSGVGLLIIAGQLQTFQTPMVTAAGAASVQWLQGEALTTMLQLAGVTMALIQVCSTYITLVPAPLIALAVTTFGVRWMGLPVPTIGDVASISGSLPFPALPAIVPTFQHISVIVPAALALALVGLLESLLTQQLVDEVTQSRSPTHTECIGQGAANVVCGLLGGIGGCGMIGQSMVNMNSGGRNRISGIAAGAFIVLFVTAGSAIIEAVPLGCLAGVMFMVAVSTFRWATVLSTDEGPPQRGSVAVLGLVSLLTLWHGPALAVGVGLLVCCLKFAWRSSQRMNAKRQVLPSKVLPDLPLGKKRPKPKKPQGSCVYFLDGPLFFGSADNFSSMLDPKKEPLDAVILDFEECRVWDSTGIQAIYTLATAYYAADKKLTLRHLSEDCRRLLTARAVGGPSLFDMEVSVEEDPCYGVAMDYDRVIQGTVSGWAPRPQISNLVSKVAER